ncbi:hypothetical protein Psi02_33980 [Planotetraspora silvatica]|uniref:Uncharacterized protein n=1 Tax=Planotetraspora silvatica TaxID=234614 RepID=A0A8J3UJL5_9ACTN|nr:hypothetical protein [Planotetraspora silvatica]GII46974.1 hypothetical protein Psi02_33980 [Planotetraspora silvatica]
MSDRELTTVYVFRLGEAYDDLEPMFSVDGRDYTDPDSVRADVRAASLALSERNLIADYETSQASPTTPRTGLPSWPQWRARHIENEEPIGVRPRPAHQATPPGWDDMGRWLEHSEIWLRGQVTGAAGVVAGGRVSVISDIGPQRVGRGSIDLAEEQYRVDCAFLVVPPAGRPIPELLEAIAGWLRAAGWTIVERVEKPRSTTVVATNMGHEIALVWPHRDASVTLLGKSPTVDATWFGRDGPAADV